MSFGKSNGKASPNPDVALPSLQMGRPVCRSEPPGGAPFRGPGEGPNHWRRNDGGVPQRTGDRAPCCSASQPLSAAACSFHRATHHCLPQRPFQTPETWSSEYNDMFALEPRVPSLPLLCMASVSSAHPICEQAQYVEMQLFTMWRSRTSTQVLRTDEVGAGGNPTSRCC